MAITASPEPPTVATTRSLAGLTDSELVAEVRRGCDRAFEHLYERYHRRVAAYIYGMVNDYGRAEDLAQDVFISGLRRMRETDRPIAFKPWVYEIAKNACIDQFRRTRRGEEVSFDAEGGLGAADYGRLVATDPAPDVAVDQKMAIDHLRGAFGGLSQTHHEILVMREFEGLSYREIGERLGMSRPSVESTLFRARRRLGEEYEELVSGQRCRRVQSIIGTTGAAPGARDQRRLAAHLSHCQPCRRHAKVAGLNAAALAPRRARAKIAALIPLPVFLRRRWFGEEMVANPHVSSLAQLSAQLSPSVDPVITSWAKAAAAAATLAVAGVAGGAAVSDTTRSGPGSPVAEQRSPTPPQGPAPAARPAEAVAAAPSLTTTDGAGRLPAATPAPPQLAVPSAGAVGAPAVPPAGAEQPLLDAGPETIVGGFDPGVYPAGGGRPSAGATGSTVAAAAAEAAAVAAARASAASATAAAVAAATAAKATSDAATSSAATRTRLEGAAGQTVDAAAAAAKAATESLLGG